MRGLLIDRGRADSWINFVFPASSIDRAWTVVQVVFGNRRWGAALRRSTIVTCQGSRGWDDYKLLHHFDPAQTLDRLPAPRRNAR